MEELRGRKYVLGPKGFKTIIKSKRRVHRPLLVNEELGGGDWQQVLSCPGGGQRHVLLLQVSHLLNFSTPNLKVSKVTEC